MDAAARQRRRGRGGRDLRLPRPGPGDLLSLLPRREGQRRPVPLKEYLEHVWAAVSKEAISTIFRDADAAGLEPDARLTAMWLWTVGGGAPAANGKDVG